MEMEKKLSEILAIKDLQCNPLYYKGKDTRKRVITDETDTIYGVVGRTYKPVTYSQVYGQVTEWLPNVVLKGIATGGFHKYSKVAISFELPKTYKVDGQEILTYINVINSLDGSTPIGLMVSPVRMICMNQFNLAKRKSFIRISHKHTSTGIISFNKDVQLVEKIYNALEGQISIAEKLVKMDITTDKGVKFLENLLNKNIISKKVEEKATNLWVYPIRNEDKPRNLWSLFNAITDPMNRTLESKNKISTFNQLHEIGSVFTKELVTI